MDRRRALLAASQTGGGNDGPITFFVLDADGVNKGYTIPYQMTWQEFVDSEYNEIWYENKYGKYYEFAIAKYNGRVEYKDYPVHDGDYMYDMSSDKIKEVQYYAD